MVNLELSFDDGNFFDFKLIELLQKYNLVKNTVLYFPVDALGVNARKLRQGLNLDEMRQLSEIVEIGSHTISHQLLTRVSEKRARQEVIESKTMLEDLLQQPITKFCYPRGYANADIIGYVREAGYTSARNTLVGNLYEAEDPLWQSTTVHVGIQRNEYGDQHWLDYAKSLWDKAKSIEKSNPIYHIWGHSYEIEENKEWENFEKLLEHIK